MLLQTKPDKKYKKEEEEKKVILMAPSPTLCSARPTHLSLEPRAVSQSQPSCCLTVANQLEARAASSHSAGAPGHAASQWEPR